MNTSVDSVVRTASCKVALVASVLVLGLAHASAGLFVGQFAQGSPTWTTDGPGTVSWPSYLNVGKMTIQMSQGQAATAVYLSTPSASAVKLSFRLYVDATGLPATPVTGEFGRYTLGSYSAVLPQVTASANVGSLDVVDFQLNAGEQIYFRLLPWDVSKSGNAYLGVEPVPEPWVGALSAGVLGLAIGSNEWRRRRVSRKISTTSSSVAS